MSHNPYKPLNNFIKGWFFAIFFSTGFSALIFQVIWQRVLTLHAGVDLYSVTTVVAAFMAGLGLGSLLGGYVADRLSIRNCFMLFIVSNIIIGIFGYFSLWLLYDVYSSVIPYLEGTVRSFLFHFILLCVPTTFMGLSLPLLSKALVRTNDEMSSLVGALYGINTLGAAVGAGLGTWYMLGTFGFVANVQIASTVNICCGLVAAILLYKLRSESLTTSSSEMGQQTTSSITGVPEQEMLLSNKPGVWIFVYGITGFAALSLEIVWFRIFSVISRSHSYVFGHLLFVFLCGVGLGCLIASLLVKRIKRPDKLFLWMQYVIGIASLLIPLTLISLPKNWQITQFIIYLFSWGLPLRPSFEHFIKYFIVINLIAVIVFGFATVLMGMCFPLIQRVVSRQMTSLGRNLSKLLFANIVGNIIGTIVTGFIFLHYFGTPATLKILGFLLLIPGLIAANGHKSHRFTRMAAVSLLSLTCIFAFPGDTEFWRFFHLSEADEFVVIEERSSVNALVRYNRDSRDVFEVLTNGHSYKTYIPYGGNGSKLGLALGLYHPNPKKGLVIGFGSGNTLYSLARDQRLEKIKVIELIAGQVKLLERESGREGLWQLARIFNDPRIEVSIGDGRKFLLHTDETFDVIEIDALHPKVAYSGNLYSVEFFDLIKKHLAPGGIFCQWLPTARVENTVLKVFPYVVRFDNLFVLATNDPLQIDKAAIVERFAKINMDDSYGQAEREGLTKYINSLVPEVIQAGSTSDFPDHMVGYDLFPKDEYFINNKIDRNFRKPLQ